MQIALIRSRGSSTGGAELYAARLMTALVAGGHDVHLLAERWDNMPAGVRLHPLEVTGSRAQRPVRLAEAAAATVTRARFQCVLSLERTACQHVYRAGDGVHRVWLEQYRRFSPWWRRPFIGLGAFHRNVLNLERLTFDPTRTRHVIVNSTMVRDEIVRCFGFPADRIHLVRNGVRTERFRSGQRDATRARLGIRPDEYVLLFVGSGWVRKGLPVLVEVMKRFHARRDSVKLIVVGKGRLRGVPPNVIFAGTTDAVQDFYAAADLFTFPPIYEPSANVVFEALAAGLPVITTVFNGAGEVLTPGIHGTILPDPADANALEEAIQSWRAKPGRIPFPTETIDLDRNVAETVRILEIAASTSQP
jgi:UDP-glucose:(heptosyl)LPS alpha-1,3-glucosyltransferase